jgi:hypothetical protein
VPESRIQNIRVGERLRISCRTMLDEKPIVDLTFRIPDESSEIVITWGVPESRPGGGEDER